VELVAISSRNFVTEVTVKLLKLRSPLALPLQVIFTKKGFTLCLLVCHL